MHKSVTRNKQTGFTLIELVVVIVILGILAATALPRFLNVSTTARTNAMAAIAGSANSAASMAHAQYLIVGGTPASVTLDGTAVAMAFGYPDSTAAGIGAATNFASPSGNVTFTAGTWQDTKAGTPASCQVAYTAATSLTVPPTIVTTTSGC